jgi:Uma2 family endonuclease
MRAVLLEVPPHLLEERRRLGVDRWDEMWEGVLHMVPPPAERHQSLGSRLVEVLGPLARRRGLKFAYEIGLFGADDDYRVPDLVAYRPAQASARGLEVAAELVVELVSPGDESREKLPWYAAQGVTEVVLIDRDTLAVAVIGRSAARRCAWSAPARPCSGAASSGWTTTICGSSAGEPWPRCPPRSTGSSST